MGQKPTGKNNGQAKRHVASNLKARAGYWVDVDPSFDYTTEVYISADNMNVIDGALVFTQHDNRGRALVVCAIPPGKWNSAWHLDRTGDLVGVAPHLDDRGGDIRDLKLRGEFKDALVGVAHTLAEAALGMMRSPSGRTAAGALRPTLAEGLPRAALLVEVNEECSTKDLQDALERTRDRAEHAG